MQKSAAPRKKAAGKGPPDAKPAPKAAARPRPPAASRKKPPRPAPKKVARKKPVTGKKAAPRKK
ncbi:MAG: hypothetical protein GYA21_09530 [Myxococcales bacterium]|nr:hypothetical protein [Myxococcales bacterium]